MLITPGFGSSSFIKARYESQSLVTCLSLILSWKDEELFVR